VLEQKMSLFDIKVLRMDFFKLDTLGAEVQALGILLNREREATWFCEWHQRHCNMIRKRLEGIVSHPPVYVESYTDYHAVGPGSGGHEMCVRAGGRNIAAELSIPYPRVTPEWVLSQNPVVIIKAASYGNGYARADSTCFNKLRDALLSRPAWEHISAVATGKVHVMDSAIWTGPRCCIGLAYMARWFYPDLFPDLDPVSLHKEYLELFQRIPYQGIFVSDEIGGRGR
jgi:iron complex transport system substrate-binding protein